MAPTVYTVWLVNKAGGLIYQRTVGEGFHPKGLTSNDYLILASTFQRYLHNTQLAQWYIAYMQYRHKCLPFPAVALGSKCLNGQAVAMAPSPFKCIACTH